MAKKNCTVKPCVLLEARLPFFENHSRILLPTMVDLLEVKDFSCSGMKTVRNNNKNSVSIL